MAKAARRVVESGDKYTFVDEDDVATLEWWAAAVPEHRGARQLRDSRDTNRGESGRLRANVSEVGEQAETRMVEPETP